MRPILTGLDVPPSWLVLHLAAAWALSFVSPNLLGGAGHWGGKTFVALGILMMGTAIVTMTLARTTIIPRRNPSTLVTAGVFSVSRNPIYLADAMILFGAVLWLDSVLALPLVLSFVWLIQTRFIRDEEARLTAAFGPEFDLWAARTNRWIGRK